MKNHMVDRAWLDKVHHRHSTTNDSLRLGEANVVHQRQMLHTSCLVSWRPCESLTLTKTYSFVSRVVRVDSSFGTVHHTATYGKQGPKV